MLHVYYLLLAFSTVKISIKTTFSIEKKTALVFPIFPIESDKFTNINSYNLIVVSLFPFFKFFMFLLPLATPN